MKWESESVRSASLWNPAAWLVGCFRQRRPSHSTSAVADILRSRWASDELVRVIPPRLCTAHTLLCNQFYTVGSRVWSTTRLSFRLNSLPTLHCRFAAAYQVPPAHATCLRGRHSSLRFCRPHEVSMLADRVYECIDKTSAWMMANRLQLNPAKSEILWCTSARRQHQIPTGPVRIGNTTVLPVSQVRDLGVYLDADVTIWKRMLLRPSEHVSRRCDRYEVCDVPYHATPCWPWLEHWWSAR